MPSYLKPGLTPDAASHICMNECQAQCCRGPLILRLSGGEARLLESLAKEQGLDAAITAAPDGGGWLKFSDHAREHCPFLDDTTSACRIYENRPRRCREFPEKPTPGCPISGYS